MLRKRKRSLTLEAPPPSKRQAVAAPPPPAPRRERKREVVDKTVAGAGAPARPPVREGPDVPVRPPAGSGLPVQPVQPPAVERSPVPSPPAGWTRLAPAETSPITYEEVVAWCRANPSRWPRAAVRRFTPSMSRNEITKAWREAKT